MSVDITVIKTFLPFIHSELQQAFAHCGMIKEIPAGTEIIHEGQSIKQIPVVLEGLVKVYTRNEDRELLLYYIEARESCVMSFLAGLKNIPSRIIATTEESTKILLLPSDRVQHWIHDFPQLNSLFYDLYNTRYTELIDSLNQLIFQKLDSRLFDYLKEKSRVRGQSTLTLRHREIALELGTSREVITRVMKKLEKEGKIKQTSLGIVLI
jgi:CRP/FNR family transcriptional regulator, anaerobic regulatory protein